MKTCTLFVDFLTKCALHIRIRFWPDYVCVCGSKPETRHAGIVRTRVQQTRLLSTSNTDTFFSREKLDRFLLSRFTPSLSCWSVGKFIWPIGFRSRSRLEIIHWKLENTTMSQTLFLCVIYNYHFHFLLFLLLMLCNYYYYYYCCWCYCYWL